MYTGDKDEYYGASILGPELAKSGSRIRIKAEVSGQNNEYGNFHTILSPSYASRTIVNATLNILQPMLSWSQLNLNLISTLETHLTFPLEFI